MNIQYGICGGPERGNFAAPLGYDFLEWTVAGLLCPLEDEVVFLQKLKEIKSCALPCPVVNVFIPGHLKITGEQIDTAALDKFLETAIKRGAVAGVKTIVLGSGGARRVPDDFPFNQAEEQLARFCYKAAKIAATGGITIVLEPLNKNESNIINSVAEGAAMVRKVGHPNMKLLVDAYHWGLEDDSAEAIASNGDLLHHVHIATVPNRLPPGGEPYDFSAFFAALSRAGYSGGISIEGKIADEAKPLKDALALMKKKVLKK